MQLPRTDAKTLDGTTALMDAAKAGDAEIVRSLMDKGADVRARAADGWTALMFAASYGNTDALQELLEKSDVSAETPEGVTALKAAEGAGHLKEAGLLKKAGAKR
jgi:ankyrin repeat protein